jgi:metallo-beta-lactamase class B
MNRFLLATLFLCLGLGLTSHAQKLDIRPLTEGIFVFTTYKEYNGNLVGANGLYIVTEAGVALLDMPWDTTQCLPLLDSIQARHHVPVRWSISSHSHADRTGSIDILRRHGVATYASCVTQQLCREQGECVPEFAFAQDTAFVLGNLRVETFYPGPGHTPDNIVVWLPQSKVLYGGCFVKSTQARDLGNLADANVAAWPASMQAVIDRYPEVVTVIPGHDGWKNVHSPQHTLKLLRQHSKKTKSAK